MDNRCTVKLYRIEMCPYCARVKKKLEELGLGYEEVDVPKPRSSRDEVRRLSGQRAVPILVDGETVVSDSARIVEYLEGSYG